MAVFHRRVSYVKSAKMAGNGHRRSLSAKPDVEIWWKPDKWTRSHRLPIRLPLHYGVYLDAMCHFSRESLPLRPCKQASDFEIRYFWCRFDFLGSRCERKFLPLYGRRGTWNFTQCEGPNERFCHFGSQFGRNLVRQFLSNFHTLYGGVLSLEERRLIKTGSVLLSQKEVKYDKKSRKLNPQNCEPHVDFDFVRTYVICCFVSKPQCLKGQFLHFLTACVKIRGRVGQISKSIFRAIICAPETCFRLPICCSVSKLQPVKGDRFWWESTPNVALFDPL